MNLSEYYILTIIDFVLLSQNLTLCLSISIRFSSTELDPTYFRKLYLYFSTRLLSLKFVPYDTL